MATKKYLDLNGLSRVWNKISGEFAAADEVINATDLTVTNRAVNLVDYVDSPGIYKVPSMCWIYTDSANSTTGRIHALAGDIVKIEPQVDTGDGEEIVEFTSYFTILGDILYIGGMVTEDNITWTSNITRYEQQSNKVTTISSSSSNTQYPSAKAVYDYAAQKAIYSDSSINLGRKTNTTIGVRSTAEGIDATASGIYSHAEGQSTTASNGSAHAEGQWTTATGEASHAEGTGTTASDYAHAEGNGATASGYNAHAEGENAIASGYDSHAEGYATTASGSYSHAEGYVTIAQRKSQHTRGEYNVADTNGTTTTRGKYADIVGNGTSNSARSNAYTLDWSGNGCFAGDVYVGAADKDDANAKKLATEDYIDSLMVDGVKKTMLYNGKENNTAILTGVTQALTDSIFNYDLIVVGFNCLVGSTRVMELTMPVYPKSGLIVFCDSAGTGATGAYHIVNANTGFASGNAYRVMWGFTDATHIRNIISNQVGWGSPGIAYVVGYKFSALPDGYATTAYVDNAITGALGGSY